MKNDRYSIATLMIIVTAAGLLAWVTNLAIRGSTWATILSGSVFVAIMPFALYAAAFLVVYPFGILNNILEKGSEEPQSPFAQDRLPAQQAIPANDSDKAH